jgi:acyl-CoA synthetase (AMP-forming)/AMP-acid ligase II
VSLAANFRSRVVQATVPSFFQRFGIHNNYLLSCSTRHRGPWTAIQQSDSHSSRRPQPRYHHFTVRGAANSAVEQSPCRIFLIDDRTQASVAVTLGSFTADPDAPVMYQFSSGSTGPPKRIARTHRNLEFELNSLVRTLALTHEDRFLGVTPFSHVNGLMRSMMASPSRATYTSLNSSAMPSRIPSKSSEFRSLSECRSCSE